MPSHEVLEFQEVINNQHMTVTGLEEITARQCALMSVIYNKDRDLGKEYIMSMITRSCVMSWGIELTHVYEILFGDNVLNTKL